MTRFRKRRKTVVVSFAEHEADILANLLRNLVELLYDGMPPRAARSCDPLADLLSTPTDPPPRRRTSYCSGCCRTPTRPTTWRRPSSAASPSAACATARSPTPSGCCPPSRSPAPTTIALEPDEQLSWLRALNDLRLAIGTRLDIKEEDDYATWEKLPDDDPRRLTYDLYDWLGYLQSALLHNMR